MFTWRLRRRIVLIIPTNTPAAVAEILIGLGVRTCGATGPSPAPSRSACCRWSVAVPATSPTCFRGIRQLYAATVAPTPTTMTAFPRTAGCCCPAIPPGRMVEGRSVWGMMSQDACRLVPGLTAESRAPQSQPIDPNAHGAETGIDTTALADCLQTLVDAIHTRREPFGGSITGAFPQTPPVMMDALADILDPRALLFPHQQKLGSNYPQERANFDIRRRTARWVSVSIGRRLCAWRTLHWHGGMKSRPKRVRATSPSPTTLISKRCQSATYRRPQPERELQGLRQVHLMSAHEPGGSAPLFVVQGSSHPQVTNVAHKKSKVIADSRR